MIKRFKFLLLMALALLLVPAGVEAAERGTETAENHVSASMEDHALLAQTRKKRRKRRKKRKKRRKRRKKTKKKAAEKAAEDSAAKDGEEKTAGTDAKAEEKANEEKSAATDSTQPTPAAATGTPVDSASATGAAAGTEGSSAAAATDEAGSAETASAPNAKAAGSPDAEAKSISAAPAGEGGAAQAAPQGDESAGVKEEAPEPSSDGDTDADDALGIMVMPKVGALIPAARLKTSFFGAIEVGYRLPFLDRLLGVVFEFAYVRPSLASGGIDPAVSGAYSFDMTNQAFVLQLNAAAFLGLGPITLYGGVGPGMYILRTKTESFGSVVNEGSTEVGVQVLAGVGYELWHGHLAIEGRYHYNGIGFVATGDSNTGGFTASMGYRFLF